MSRLLFTVGAMSLLASSGCFSHYSGGPEFAHVKPPSGYAVVHVYRPKKAWGALQMIEASQPGRVAILPSGGYATFVVPAGQVTMTSAINTWSQIIAVYAPGAASGVAAGWESKATLAPVSIDAMDGGVYFIRTEFTSFKEAPSATLVDAETGSSDIGGLHLAAGGRGRYPVTPWVSSAPTQLGRCGRVVHVTARARRGRDDRAGGALARAPASPRAAASSRAARGGARGSCRGNGA